MSAFDWNSYYGCPVQETTQVFANDEDRIDNDSQKVVDPKDLYKIVNDAVFHGVEPSKTECSLIKRKYQQFGSSSDLVKRVYFIILTVIAQSLETYGEFSIPAQLVYRQMFSQFLVCSVCKDGVVTST